MACLDQLGEVEAVADAENVRDAWEHPALFAADLVLIDPKLAGGEDFVGAVREATGAAVIVCSSDTGQESVVRALQAGALGYLRKDELTPEALGAAMRAAASGTGVLAGDLLGSLVPRGAGHSTATHAAPATLTDREQQVL